MQKPFCKCQYCSGDLVLDVFAAALLELLQYLSLEGSYTFFHQFIIYFRWVPNPSNLEGSKTSEQIEHSNFEGSRTPYPPRGVGGVDSTNPFGILMFLLILWIAYPDIGWLFLNIYWLDLGTKKIEIFLGGTTFSALRKYWDLLKIGLEKITQIFIAESFDTGKMRMFARN